MSISARLLKSGLTTLVLVAVALGQSQPPLITVPSVDLDRYTGEWYEIARYPNHSEKECESDVTAVYSMRDDGRLQVVNSCRKASGVLTESSGYAKIVDKKTNAKLKVTSFGDYWIVDLDSEYRFAVVSEPKRKYLWILSRTPHMDPVQYDQVIARIRRLGFDPDRLIRTTQSVN